MIIVFSVWYSTKILQINIDFKTHINKKTLLKMNTITQFETCDNQTHEKLYKFYKTPWNLQS